MSNDKRIRDNSANLREEAAKLREIAKQLRSETAEINYECFMMRGEEEVFLAMMDKLGVKLDPKELRDFQIN